MQQFPRVTFTFHNAGQGLFYSGNINGFAFIYDCGSDRKQHLNDIVVDYKNELVNGLVNLLILSHLHEDHVSGLHTLFYNKPKTYVNQVILPYLSPIERLVLAIQASGPGSINDRWYYNFLADPVQFLIENGVEAVTYLGGNQPEGVDNFERRENRQSDKNNDDEQSKDFTDNLKESPSLRRTILTNEPHLSKISTNRLKIKSHDGAIRILANVADWQFRFYNYSVRPQMLQSFFTCVKNLFGDADISEIITDESRRIQLRTCYKLLWKTDFNNTSLLVLHGPIPNTLHSRIKSAQLLTGDISFKWHISEIVNHFGGDLSNVSLCLIPHHGSKRNWDNAILQNVSSPCRWVVSSGQGNKTQPHIDVLQEIKNSGHNYAICDDDCKLTINFSNGWLANPLSINSSIIV